MQWDVQLSHLEWNWLASEDSMPIWSRAVCEKIVRQEQEKHFNTM